MKNNIFKKMEFSIICVIWELIAEQWSCVYRIGE